LVDSLSWHWVFYINIPIGLLAIFLSLLYYREGTIKETPKFDVLGSFLIIVGLTLLLLGIQLLGLTNSWIVISLVIAGIVLLVLFFMHEKNHTNPVVPISMFKNRALVGDFLLLFLAGELF
jgi:Glucose dehydrogenase